jgi:hypothetical protein
MLNPSLDASQLHNIRNLLKKNIASDMECFWKMIFLACVETWD